MGEGAESRMGGRGPPAYERLSTKAAKAVLANVMIELLNIPRPGFVPFEALWNVAGLQNSYSSGIDRNVNVDLKKLIKESLR